MIENKIVMDSHWKFLEDNLNGIENMVEQPEHAGIDFYGFEIIEGDEIVTDNINGEVILKENLERYLQEHCNFDFKQAE